jgi:hypothetical protein
MAMANLNPDGTNPDILRMKAWDAYATAAEQAKDAATAEGDTSLAATLGAIAVVMRDKQRAAAVASGEPWALVP